MQIKKRTTATVVGGLILFWQLVVQPVWNLNVERLAERNNLDTTLTGSGIVTWLSAAFNYLPSSFATGFAVGALLFAYWDVIVRWYERHFTKDGEAPRVRAWTGGITPYFDMKERELSLYFYIIGVGDIPFRFGGVDGAVYVKGATSNGGKRRTALGKPHIIQDMEGYLNAGEYCGITINMRIPDEVYRDLPDAFIWRPRTYLEFDDFNIWLETKRGTRKRLKLWESMRLTTGDNEVRYVETFSINKNGETDKMLEALNKVVETFGPKS